MATYYPNVSYPRDYLSTPCPGDQKSTPVAGTRPHPSSSPMYLSQHSSSGEFSDILSGSSLNGVAITSVGGRNEMSFLPTTSNCENLQSVDEQLSVQSSHVIHNHVGLDPQNFQSQGLSLSLGTQIQSGEQLPSFQYQFQGYPSMFSNFAPFSAKGTLNCSIDEVRSNDMRNFESIASGFAGANGSSTETEALSHLQYSLGHKVVHSDIYPYGSGFSNATILNTKYLKAARELLDEVVNIHKALAQPDPDKHQTSQPKPSNGVSSEPSESITNSNSELSPAERKELQNKKTKLMTMLDEVDRRYRQYYHQMKIVVTCFDAIAGPGAAKPYTALAVQTISRHFRSLRDAISGQIQVARKSLGEEDTSSNSQGVIPRLRYVDHQLKQQRALQQLGVTRHAWRPQRGLPESSVSILRAWLFEHFLHPYPKDSEKSMLAKQTGLTRNQVANWFINARVRLWKPMIEDMYKEEFGEKDESSKSSLEKAEKPAGEDSSASDDRKEDLQDSMTSKASDANCVQPGTIQGLNFDHIPDAETHGHFPSHAEVTRLQVIQGPKIDSVYPDTMLTPGQNGNNSFMAGPGMYDLTGLGGFAGGNQVSLALGLQHQQNNAFHLSADANMQRNNTVTSASEPDTVDFHRTDPANEQNRPMYYMIL